MNKKTVQVSQKPRNLNWIANKLVAAIRASVTQSGLCAVTVGTSVESIFTIAHLITIGALNAAGILAAIAGAGVASSYPT